MATRPPPATCLTGSTTALTDGSGNSVASYGYDVFGALRSQSGSSDNFWLFTGEQHDADSGMYYLRARYYDPAIGRFLSQDPLGAGHPYVYGSNNPVRYVDPLGLLANEGGLSPESFRMLQWWLLEHGSIPGHDVYVWMCLEDGSCLLYDCHGPSDLRDCWEIWITDSPGLLDTLLGDVQSAREFLSSCPAGIGGIVITIATEAANTYSFATGRGGQPPDPNAVAWKLERNIKKCSR